MNRLSQSGVGHETFDEEAALALFDSCSNWGQWGDDDQRGTLNYIGVEQTIAAARLVQLGEVLSLGKAITSATPAAGAQRHMLEQGAPTAQNDLMILATHHPALTHMDAIGHVFFNDVFYNGRPRADTRDRSGLLECDVAALAGGVVTRGVLLDVAAAMGVEYLPRPFGIGRNELEAAERYGNVNVGRGDAIFVRIGLSKRLAAEGGYDARDVGLTVDAVPWIHEREVALFSGDCIEQLPSPFPRLSMPLHEIGLPAMGLVIVDNADVEELSARCRELGRFDFMLMMAPLRFQGATGSPVNPVAVF